MLKIIARVAINYLEWNFYNFFKTEHSLLSRMVGFGGIKKSF